MVTHTQPTPDLPQPGLTMTAPPVLHQGRSDNYAAGDPTRKCRGRDSITAGTWNERTLKPAGKFAEPTHEMVRYRWNLLGLCKARWKNFNGETSTGRDTVCTAAAKRTSTNTALPFLFTGKR